jgi:hypothetical protein
MLNLVLKVTSDNLDRVPMVFSEVGGCRCGMGFLLELVVQAHQKTQWQSPLRIPAANLHANIWHKCFAGRTLDGRTPSTMYTKHCLSCVCALSRCGARTRTACSSWRGSRWVGRE